MITNNIQPSKALELISGLLKLGYSHDGAAEAAIKILGVEKPSVQDSAFKLAALKEAVALIGDSEVTWSEWMALIMCATKKSAKTAQKRIKDATASGLVIVRKECSRNRYSMKTEAAK